jgi:4-diphosphocytidyl-2-C-methyl-D-erythritol kinase
MPRCLLRLKFDLCKNIPMQGGLAGGSADAAAALLLVNEACGNALSEDRLCDIGAALGADIPFCIRGLQGAQTARGIGEVMTPAPGISTDMTLLVVLPGTTVSTPAAFALLDDRYGSAESRERAVQNERRYEAHIKALLSGDPTTFAKTSFNRFEEAVFSLQPQTKEVFDRVVALGGDMVRMSGSGPTIVAAFADADAASRAEKVLLEQGYMAHRCHTLPATQNL